MIGEAHVDTLDTLTAKQLHLATASMPVVRLADEATIARYVERLRAVLLTGTPPARFPPRLNRAHRGPGHEADRDLYTARRPRIVRAPRENSGLTKVLPGLRRVEAAGVFQRGSGR